MAPRHLMLILADNEACERSANYYANNNFKFRKPAILVSPVQPSSSSVLDPKLGNRFPTRYFFQITGDIDKQYLIIYQTIKMFYLRQYWELLMGVIQ